MLKLDIQPEVAAKILAKKQENERILLDNEDGRGPFVDHAISCQLNPSFQLFLVDDSYTDEELKDYSLTVETAVGPVSFKESATRLLDQENRLVIEPTYGRIQLKSDGGILASDVKLVTRSKAEPTA
ncbi:iron-sulfur cluster biosynthesis family protein [Enterococcus bulliens]